jgi:delta 1-pyrroline-5-carboxylate dehydrogenase
VLDVCDGGRVRQHVRAQALGAHSVGIDSYAEFFLEAGVPKGVFNVVQGDKVVVDALIEHPDVVALSSLGSTPVAEYIHSESAKRGKRVHKGDNRSLSVAFEP